MAAPFLDVPLRIDEGATFAQAFVLTDPTSGDPIDLTGYTAASDVKLTYDSAVLVSFTCTIDPLIGQITLSLAADDTVLSETLPTGLCDTPVSAVFDIFITLGSVVTRILKGSVLFYPRVTD